jgi:hypothetical protein
MRHIKLFTLTVAAVALSTACSGGRGPTGGGGGGSSGNGGGSSAGGSSAGGSSTGGSSAGGSSAGGGSSTGGSSAGGGSSTGGSGTGGGTGSCPTITVNDAVNNLILYENACVQIQNAAVVGVSTAFMSTSATCIGNKMQETFYIQDNGAAAGSPGIAIFKSCKDDTMALPSVGDIVAVSGRLSSFDGSLQVSGSPKYMIPEQLSVTGSGGMSSSGAYPPAGMPVSVPNSDTSYAHDAMAGDPHPDQLGVAIKFTGVTVIDRYPVGFYSTNSDGGRHTAGFELSNHVWVDDSIIFHDCISPLASDAGIPLTNMNIQGFWDRYQDFYGGTKLDGGGFQDAPILPVLVPLTCADLQVQ